MVVFESSTIVRKTLVVTQTRHFSMNIVHKLTVHKQQTRLGALQDNGSLATESTSNHDDDSAGGAASSHLRGVSDGAGTLLGLDVVSRVVLTLGTLGLSSGLILEGKLLQCQIKIKQIIETTCKLFEFASTTSLNINT